MGCGGDRHVDLCFSGSYPLMAVSNAVSGPVRGSLTVQCRYEPGWETYKKWWCRGANWENCRILVKTNGSGEKAKGNQVSIQDNQKMHTFTVTMEELRWNNADTYWCGIEKSGTDLGVKVKVTIDPGKMAIPTLCSISSVRGKGIASIVKALFKSIKYFLSVSMR
uniref:Immunoglobulin V-set domain-containing protein n=1 Tax=Panthera leo TaxID=9689 RepID=A0A8C8WSK3_PANLE